MVIIATRPGLSGAMKLSGDGSLNEDLPLVFSFGTLLFLDSVHFLVVTTSILRDLKCQDIDLVRDVYCLTSFAIEKLKTIKERIFLFEFLFHIFFI